MIKIQILPTDPKKYQPDTAAILSNSPEEDREKRIHKPITLCTERVPTKHETDRNLSDIFEDIKNRRIQKIITIPISNKCIYDWFEKIVLY